MDDEEFRSALEGDGFEVGQEVWHAVMAAVDARQCREVFPHALAFPLEIYVRLTVRLWLDHADLGGFNGGFVRN